jgi:hypothetical protein
VKIDRRYIQEACVQLGVQFVPHSKAGLYTNIGRWARLLGWKDWERVTWMTQRPRIYYPDGIIDPLDFWQTIAHELVHWKQQGPSLWGRLAWMVRYGISERFRYEAEREAFLVTIKVGDGSPRQIARDLRAFYRITSVPEAEMEEWLTAHSVE